MKIAIILEERIYSGGGYFQSLNTIESINKSINQNYEIVVYTSIKENEYFLNERNITTKIFKKTFFDYIYLYVKNLWTYKYIQLVINKSITSNFEKKLLTEQIDFVVYTSPTSLTPLLLNKINFSLSIWDNSHIDFPEFPEVRGNVFSSREFFLKQTMPLSFFIITDSEELSEKLSYRYGIDKNKFIKLPFFISPMLRLKSKNDVEIVIEKNIPKNNFIFYPAQYWPHKNHIAILNAILILKKRGYNSHVVFCGKDYSNKKNISNFIKKNNLDNNVTLLDYVSNDEMNFLYSNCKGVIMTSYFGPTNIPPIESWYYLKPLIYSKHLKNQVGEAAILVDCDDSENIAAGIMKLENKEIVSKITIEGLKMLKNIENEILEAQNMISNSFNKFNIRKNNWKC